MSDWRERVSGPAREDFEALMAMVLPAAESTLQRFGKLQPFGAAVTVEGDVIRINADQRLGLNPLPRDVVRGLYSGARAAAFARRAMAVVQIGRSGGSEAMRIDMEHSDGHCVAVIVPYSISRFKKTYTRGTLVAGASQRHVWTEQPERIDLRTGAEVASTEATPAAQHIDI